MLLDPPLCLAREFKKALRYRRPWLKLGCSIKEEEF
jgi:hypothetical protein